MHSLGITILRFFVFSCVALVAASADAATFTVDVDTDATDASPGDGDCATASGDCSLRAAIEETNALAGADIIEFNIPGAGVHRISPATALPFLTGEVTIDGYSQPGASPNSAGMFEPSNAVILIELDGSNAPPETADGNAGLRVNGGDSAVRGLAIFGWAGTNNGRIWINSSNNFIDGNHLGLNADGTSAGEAAGTFANSVNGYGVRIVGGAGNVIGGTVSKATNVIANAWRAAVWVMPGAEAAISRNFIGVDASGTGIPLGTDSGAATTGGVWFQQASGSVGGSSSAANVICGTFGPNTAAVTVDDSDGVTVADNYIQWRADGVTECGSDANGVTVLGGSVGAVVLRNRIRQTSARAGVRLAASLSASVAENVIGAGTDGTTFTTAAGPGTAGITLAGATNAEIADNIIAYRNTGIYVPTASPGAVLRGNRLGVSADGDPTLSDGAAFYIDNGPLLIGAPSEGNVVYGGIAALYGTATGVVFTETTFASPPGVAIDLGANGATTNDAFDSDSGANNLQNHPALTTAKSIGDHVVITGSLESAASQTYRIEFFANAAASVYPRGPLELFLGATTVTTTPGGVATFEVELPQSVAIGARFTATATLCADMDCNTLTETSEPSPQRVGTGCTGDADCADEAGTHCEVGTGLCVACLTDGHCADGNACTTDTCTDNACENISLEAGTACPTGVCDGANMGPACVGCLEDNDCGVGAPNCDTNTNQCKGCVDAGDCDDGNDCTADACVDDACENTPVTAGTACGAGVCSAGACVACLEADDCGGATPLCDTGTNTCVECLLSTDCGDALPACNPATYACVACLSENDCQPGESCNLGTFTCEMNAPDGGVGDGGLEAGADDADVGDGEAPGPGDAAINPLPGSGVSGGACDCGVAASSDRPAAWGWGALALLGALWRSRRRRRR